MRKHIAWYLKGLRGTASLRNQINTTGTKADIEELLMNYLKSEGIEI